MSVYRTSEAGAIGFRNWLIQHNYSMVMKPQEVNVNDKHFHYIIRTNEENFYCLFKHEFFYTFPEKFSKFFNKYPELNSAGESINFDKLIYALNNNLTIIFIYENGVFYEVKPIDILNVHKLAEEFYPEGYNPDHPTDKGFIREQKKFNTYLDNFNPVSINERTISFPIRLLKRLI